MLENITLKFKLIKLEPMHVNNATHYPQGDGIYIVDDGVTHTIAVVSNGGVMTAMLPNKQIIDEYARHAKDKAVKCERDILTDLEHKIKVFENTLGESLKGVAEAITANAPKKQSSDIDLAGLTKLIAVAQKPDLVKGK